jgi:hypothetical protein
MDIQRAKQLRNDEYVSPTERMPNGDLIVRMQSDNETPQRYRVTRVKTWKTQPDRIEVAVRYGTRYRTTMLTQNEIGYWYPTAEVEAMIEAGNCRAWPYRKGA